MYAYTTPAAGAIDVSYLKAARRLDRAQYGSSLLDEEWYEEQLLFLLSRMQSHREKLLQQIDRLALVRPATRYEVYRRIGLATDYIHTPLNSR